MIDLEELKKSLDEALSKETPESLMKKYDSYKESIKDPMTNIDFMAGLLTGINFAKTKLNLIDKVNPTKSGWYPIYTSDKSTIGIGWYDSEDMSWDIDFAMNTKGEEEQEETIEKENPDNTYWTEWPF